MMDELIDILENVPDYRCFHFDGQTIIVDDYLRIRPENKERLHNLIKKGKLLLGPWYTMPDEFLLNGEGLVRNLQKGHEDCYDLGVAPCKNGYVCDIFGHNSQMPQIFRAFDIDNAALFRGRAGHEKTEFIWQASDGSEILVHKQHPDYAYSTFVFVGRWPFQHREIDYAELAVRIKKYLEEESPFFAADCHFMMDGVDHVDPERNLPRMLNELNERIPEYEFIHSDFADYTAEVKKNAKNLTKTKGALYENADVGLSNNLPKDTFSSMVHLKQANDYCETQLALTVEPFNCFLRNSFDTRVKYEGFINEAWRFVMKNQPHDSICGCSITPVHLDNESRFRHAKEIIGTVTDDMLYELASHIIPKRKSDGAVIVFNPSQKVVDKTTVIKIEILKHRHINEFSFYDSDGKTLLKHNMLGRTSKFKRQTEFNKLIQAPEYDVFDVVLDVQIPAYGYKILYYDFIKRERTHEDYSWKFSRYDAANRYTGSMRTAYNVVDNGCLTVEVKCNGTLKITDKDSSKVYDNMMFFENRPDFGEGWHFVPGLVDSEFMSLASAAEIGIEGDFPNLTRFKIVNSLKIPLTADSIDGRTGGLENMIIESYITVYKNSKRIDIKTTVDNRHQNHRLRVAFPTNIKTDVIKTSLPYDLYEWPIKKEDSSHTYQPDTMNYPNQGVIVLKDKESKFSLYNKGLYETCVYDRTDRTVYLTLFRSFPSEFMEYHSDMGRMLRKMEFEYAIDLTLRSDGETMKEANLFKNDILSVPSLENIPVWNVPDAKHGPNKVDPKTAIKETDSFCNISGSAVLSALYCKDGKNYIRIYDVDGGAQGKITFSKAVKKAFETDLRHKKTDDIDVEKGVIKYTLAAKKFKTICFEF